jgi:competence protein ComEC
VRAVAAIPAVGLLAGAAFGLVVSAPSRLILFPVLIVAAALAVWAWRVGSAPGVAVAVVGVFFAGGSLLAADAWHRAWRPPLRIAFEALATSQRVEAEAEGRRLPEDEEAFATLEGTLRADAAPSASGVSLTMQVSHIRNASVRGPELGTHLTNSSLATKARKHEGESRFVSWFRVFVAKASGWPHAAPRGASPRNPDRHSSSLSREREVAAEGGVLLTVVGGLAVERMGEWRAGRRISVPVQLRRPSRYLDPGVPDFERGLARRGTTLIGTVKSGGLVDVLAVGSPLDEAMAQARAFARRAITNAVGRWSQRSSAIVAAIVIGDRGGLDADVQRRLQEAGTYHVIAISGGNIAILAGLLLGGFRLAGWLGRTAMVFAMATLLAYACLVGGGASVDRATLMAVLYLGARAIDHRSPPLNTLAVAAALLVAADPLSVVDPAFVLTVGATLAILTVVPAVGTAALPRLLRPVASVFAASVATEALLLPVGAIVFSRVTFAGLGLNFLAIPLMGVAQIAGMALVPLSAVSVHAATAAGWVAHLGAEGLVRSADLVALAPVLTYRLAPPAWQAVALYYGALVPWWMLRHRRREHTGSRESRLAGRTRRAAAGVAAVAAGWILVDPRTIVAARGDGRLHVTFLDVGQGDSAFIVFPGGTTLLVDAGGLSTASAFDIGDRVVAPVVREAGFRRIDYLALTHGEPDHIGGAAAILREFRPREVWEGIPLPRSEALTALHLAARRMGTRAANVYAGDRLIADGVEIRAWHPSPPEWERQKVRNEDSLVLELRWGDVSVLLPADISGVIERPLGAEIPPAMLRVLKVPHHGSPGSSSAVFLESLRPTIAVVSAGRSNHFGHPAPAVLERYRAIGAEMFRTDRDGAVTVDTDGHSIDVHTFTGRRFSLH